ncbi:ketopantoate reductase family protein [Bacillus sp. RAR_GA_16]|uniref:ketopantoate reductase family protein n=1 Tax=Bacillus sp. RAR_GA_16 TaxID=2876774 RepID=UPI002962576A|nr:2-dehydropantoate 2-reductase N-terminal domain-containing protein [Bacillus sp. RAR_GA_16]
MKVGIAGTGAVGGFIGGKLALSNHEVVFLSRGKNLLRMQERGLKIRHSREEKIIHKEFTHLMDTFDDVESHHTKCQIKRYNYYGQTVATKCLT